MEERFEYYEFRHRVFAYDKSSTFLVYFEDGKWHEECNVPHADLLDVSKSVPLSEAQALEKTNGLSPLEYTEGLIEQDMYKNIYCP